MTDPLEVGGKGVVGVLKTFFGLNGRLQNIDRQVSSVDRRIDRLTDDVMFKDTCDATHKGVDDKFDLILAAVNKTNKGVGELLKK